MFLDKNNFTESCLTQFFDLDYPGCIKIVYVFIYIRIGFALLHAELQNRAGIKNDFA